ncbi:MAG: FFLEELY motif protein [Polaromonas sp.]
MDASAHQIQDALQAVAQLRQQHAADPPLARAGAEIKRFQARRFQATYADLLHSRRYKTAAAFFLHELYSDQDYAERDQQFARIAHTIAKLFPQAVVNTAAALAEVHALTEQLDDLMARQWLADKTATPGGSECARYIRCWRRTGDAAARHRQLEVALHLGQELNHLTRMLGLRTLLRMMRHPAAVAGLTALQHFLETGFDAFAGMRGANEFLELVDQRESEWIRSLFDDEAVTCETKLSHLLAAGSSY